MRLSGKEGRKLAKKLGVELPAGQSKFNNRRTTVDGHRFASQKEADRYFWLKLMQQQGLISELTVHPRFEFFVKSRKIGHYTADFSYVENGQLVVEDVKGGEATKTEAYKLRKRLMAAVHGINVQEV